MALLPVAFVAIAAGAGIFGAGYELWSTGKVPISIGGGTPGHPPKDWGKRDVDDRLGRALYIFPHDSMKVSHPGWDALTGLIARRKHPHNPHGEKNAVFINEAKNFSAEGTLGELGASSDHRGVTHGHITVPFGANDEMVQGKYIAVDADEADAETVDAFDSLERALQDLQRSGTNAMHFLRLAINKEKDDGKR